LDAGTPIGGDSISPAMQHAGYVCNGCNEWHQPVFLAKQLSPNLQVFFEVYAAWIDETDYEREMKISSIG
jgi:hypothetical protein